MKSICIFYALLFISITVIAQESKIIDTITKTATIKYNTNGTEINFTPKTPELSQIAGAPKAFYTYFWELGDGNYSTEETPKHKYKNTGEYEVNLWATNNYDTGKPPTTRPKKVVVNAVASDYEEVATMTTNFDLIRNREPIPNEDIVAVLKYKNTKEYTTNGRIYMFYNEHKYKASNFELNKTKTYHGEKPLIENNYVNTYKRDDSNSFLASTENELIEAQLKPQDSTERLNLPLTLEESKAYYKDWSAFDFENMQPNEERNIFFTLKTTPEMIKDTSAIISIRGVYIPDTNFDNHKIKDMEMEIVTSHDPNKMASNGTFMNYRLVRFKTLKYKIKFQNNGEGPARTIRLETDIPDMLDKSTIEVTDMYPKCKICPKREVQYSCLDTTFTNTQAIFTFKNIYLPGSEQKNVKEYDSTKGFVKYNIKFAKDFHKKKTKSRTAIIFDKNDPIITNYSTTRFIPGISIGAKVGYNMFSELNNSKSYFVGATLSPYKSYRWYWQVELLNSFHDFDANSLIEEGLVSDSFSNNYYQRTTTNTSYSNIDWEVPVLMRYNINNYIGLGAGLQGTISLSEKQKTSTFTEQFEGDTTDLLIDSFESSSETSESFSNFRTGFLVEATAGFARIGPSLGARYVFNTKDHYNYMQFYAIWKF